MVQRPFRASSCLGTRETASVRGLPGRSPSKALGKLLKGPRREGVTSRHVGGGGEKYRKLGAQVHLTEHAFSCIVCICVFTPGRDF